MTMAEKDGGPAFPKMPDEIRNGSSGMSLRDWFATSATEIFRDYTVDPDEFDGYYKRTREQARYAYADAMIAERTK